MQSIAMWLLPQPLEQQLDKKLGLFDIAFLDNATRLCI